MIQYNLADTMHLFRIQWFSLKCQTMYMGNIILLGYGLLKISRIILHEFLTSNIPVFSCFSTFENQFMK